MPVDPVLAVLAAAVVVNLILMAAVLLPPILGRRGPVTALPARRDELPDPVELAALAGRAWLRRRDLEGDASVGKDHDPAVQLRGGARGG